MGIQSLAQAAQRREETLAAAGGGNFLPELRLLNGEQATVRFLSAGDGSDDRLGVARVHAIKKVSKKGKRYAIDKPCTVEEQGHCDLCDRLDDDDESISKPVWRFAVFVWVENILHLHQNPDSEDEDEEEWVEVRTKTGKTFYKEEIQAVKLFRKGYGNKGYLFDMLLGFFEQFGTLADRSYRISRKGSDLTTSYSIVPSGSESELDGRIAKEVQKVIGDATANLVLQNRVVFDAESQTFAVAGESEETVREPKAVRKEVEPVEVAPPAPRRTRRVAPVEEAEEDTAPTPEVKGALARLRAKAATGTRPTPAVVEEVEEDNRPEDEEYEEIP